MKKTIKIEGMTCSHCQARVEKALNSISGVDAKVDLKKKAAVVSFDGDISDALFKDAVTEAGYEVVSIEEKKGLFSR
jgi:copper ion binding protein